MDRLPTNKASKGLSAIYILLSFSIPFIILMLSYIALHIAPFGDHMLVISDARGMYTSELAYIARALRGQEDVLYSFESGIGMNMMGELSYLLNPANVIVLFFDIISYPTMYSLLMAIDIAICGLTMFCFLSGVYQLESKNLIFSTTYALMGFNVAYCFHFNFILSAEILPLIALGIYRIITGKNPWLYIISLGYAILASFYFGFMLCIASVVLFLFWYVRDRHEIISMRRRIWFNYILGSLTAGLLPALVWIPALLSLSGGRLDQTSILDFTFVENMSLADLGAKFFIGANNISEEVNGQPNVFVGSFVLFLNLAFFIDRRNPLRKKIIYVVPLVFYIITFYIRAFSMVVQGFSDTNWFNYRYSFVLSFIMILIAYEEFNVFRDISLADLKRACSAYIIFVVFVFSQRFSFVTGGGMLLGVVFLAIYLSIILWNKVDPVHASTDLMVIVLLLLCSIELYANFVVCTGNLQDWDKKTPDYQNDLFFGSVLTEAVQNSDSEFYRMENEHKTDYDASNDPRLFGYNGLTYFGSCERNFVFQGMSKLGLSWWSNRMRYNEGRPSVFDSLLGVKYVISERALHEEKNYERLIEMEEKYIIYRNPYVLPIAMLATEDDIELTLGRNPFENHNNLWKSITGRDMDVFDQINDVSFTYHAGIDGTTIDWKEAKSYSASISSSIQESENSTSNNSTSNNNNEIMLHRDIQAIQNGDHIECSFIAEHDGPVYGYNGLAVDDTTGFQGDALYYIGSFHKGETVTDYIPIYDDISMNTFKMICAEYAVACPNAEVLAEYSNSIQQESGELKKIKDSYLVGHLVSKEDGRLFFTIPFDEGWTLTVDGVEAPLVKTADLFMSADIKAGEHNYEMRFIPNGMHTGIYISCSAIILLFILVIYNIIYTKQRLFNGKA